MLAAVAVGSTGEGVQLDLAALAALSWMFGRVSRQESCAALSTCWRLCIACVAPSHRDARPVSSKQRGLQASGIPCVRARVYVCVLLQHNYTRGHPSAAVP